jgi:hypothetical protein
MNNWDKTADYYENLAKRAGQDPRSQRSLLWFAETCRARASFGKNASEETRDEASEVSRARGARNR